MFDELKARNIDRLTYCFLSVIFLFMIVKLRNIVGDENILQLSATGIVALILLLITFGIYYHITVMRARNLGFNNPKLFCLLTFGIGWGLSTLSILFTSKIHFLESLTALTTSVLSISMMIFLFSPENFVQKKPIAVLFWDLRKGELRRLPFFGYSMLALSLLISSITYNVQLWSLFTEESFGFTMLFIILSYILYLYISFVLGVKRLRNIGSNSAIILMLIFSFFLGILTLLTLSNSLSFLFFLILLFFPESSSKRKTAEFAVVTD